MFPIFLLNQKRPAWILNQNQYFEFWSEVKNKSDVLLKTDSVKQELPKS
jgi:hypothetical protein